MALVDSIAKKTLERPVLGISIALANNDRVVFARGYGFADVARSVPVTSETVFHIASISKNIEAGVLLQLAEQGKLSLDEDVTRYIPDAPVHGKHVTVRQLLNHTSGIPSYTSLPDAEKNEQLDLSHEQVLALIRNSPPDFDPGTSWRYNNSGFYLAGMIAENVMHQPYGTLLHDRIFAPLQMQSSSLCDASTPVPNLASGSEVVNGKLTPAAKMSWKLPFAGGGVCSTASDLLKWQMALNKDHVVSKHSLAAMRTPTALADGASIDYGLGTRIGLLEGHPVFGATGSGGGFTTALETFPDDKLSIAVLINTGVGWRTDGIGWCQSHAPCWASPMLFFATSLRLMPNLRAFPESTIQTKARSKSSTRAASCIFEIPGGAGSCRSYCAPGKIQLRHRRKPAGALSV